MLKKDKCYVLVHGVNTSVEEANNHLKNFEEILYNRGDNSEVFNINYGFIPIWLLLIPFVSNLVHKPLINLVSNQLNKLSQEFKEVFVIAHSNGTHVAVRALESADIKDNVSLCLFGATIKCRYNFNLIADKVDRVFNFCSTRDKLIYFARSVGRGSAGYYGFRYANGDKADIKKSIEVVWNVDDSIKVINIHDNNTGHCDWINRDVFINMLLYLIEKPL